MVGKSMEESSNVKTVPKAKEKRQIHPQEGILKRNTKSGVKNDLPHLPPPLPHNGGSPVKKLLSEASKMVKIGIEKEYALLEKDHTLQSSNEIIENLRKNIVRIQMEYEKLDQNYQREISHRMDETRETFNSVMESSDVLSKSLKQLEADKFKIAEFYQVIYENQEEVEAKYLTVEKCLQEQDKVLKEEMEKIKQTHERLLSQHSETVSQLNKKCNYANDKLRVVMNENEKLQQGMQELRESSRKLETVLDQQQRLNCLHEENARKVKHSMKKLKIERFKYQKLWKNKKAHMMTFVRKCRTLKESLKDRESLYQECLSANKTLQTVNSELEKNFHKHLEEENSRLEYWESEKNIMKQNLLSKEAEMEMLKSENRNLSEKLSELSKCKKLKQAELEQVQNDLSKMLSENLKLKEDVVQLGEENCNKNKLITELENKTVSSEENFNARMESNKKESERLQNKVAELEIQCEDLRRMVDIETKQKEMKIQDIASKFEEELKLSEQKIREMEKLLEEKTNIIQKLESQQTHDVLETQKALESITDQLQREKSKNQQLSEKLQHLKETHEDLTLELQNANKQISDLKEKLADVNSLNKALRNLQTDLETTAEDLKGKISLERKSFQELEEKHKKAERELAKMEKLAEENSNLKSSVADLKNLVEATEARLEAYKVVVKKLESEKVEAKNTHSEEISRLKGELARLEEAAKTAREVQNIPMGTPEKNLGHSNEKEAEGIFGESSLHKLYTKENQPDFVDIEKWQHSTTPPLQGSRRFLSTPRKVYTSTPQAPLRNITPVQKKRDPYEFDSDGSVERFDQDKVLEMCNRSKKERVKRSKRNK